MISYQEKKGLVNYHIESRRIRLTTEDGYDFAFVPEDEEPDTACWRYDKRLKRHNIVFNEGVDRIMDRKPAKGKTWGRQPRFSFFQRVYDHEGAHSLFTESDMELLAKELKKWKIPFHLWNLFEDARIEGAWRRKYHRRFNWMRWVLYFEETPILPPPGMPMSAINLFLDCIHMENSYSALEKWVKKDKDPKVAFRSKGPPRYGRRHLIRWFYRRALRCGATIGLFPIIRDWLETFPESGGPGADGAGAVIFIHGDDMLDPREAGGKKDPMPGGSMPATAVDADGSKHKEIKETTARKSGSSGGEMDSSTGAEAVEEKEEDYHYKGASRKVKIPHNHYFSDKKQRRIDTRRADGLIRLFEKFLEGGEGMVNTRNPSGRIDMQRFLRGSESFYKKKGDDPYGVKAISFILDCSGSMSRAINDGVYLAYVLNEMVRHRKIECKQMIICGGDNYPVKMPFDWRILEYLTAPGAIEGFANAMRQHEKELVETDLTIFFTDGNITDEHIVKSEWHRKGVYSIGLFVGDSSRSESLHRWFDSVLVRDDIESIADSLIQLIKRQ